MGSVVSCLACGALCTTLSVCCSCAGCGLKSCCGSKNTETPRDIMVGRLRSMSLMLLSIILGLLTQYFWADKLANQFSFWRDGCGRSILSTCIVRSSKTISSTLSLCVLCVYKWFVRVNGFELTNVNASLLSEIICIYLRGR